MHSSTSFSRLSHSTIAIIVSFSLLLMISACEDGESSVRQFDPARDLYLPQFDSKTDVDDVHSVAGVATLLRHPDLDKIRYHAVAGAYGIQEGLYVPSPELFRKAFGNNWSDAHNNREESVDTIAQMVSNVVSSGGHVWAADAGQSDFTADWLRQVREAGISTKDNIHVVQHSDWNESVTAPEKLTYVREHADYQRIDDGNIVGNGTPGFNLESDHQWETVLQDPTVGDIWRLARDIANEYNGKDGRYKNESIATGGMDFSDVAESCWILGYGSLVDADAFFAELLDTK